MQGNYQPSFVNQKNHEPLFMQRVHTHTLQFQLQKDAYFERRIQLMRKIFKTCGLNDKSDEQNNNGHVYDDDKSLFITFSIIESEYQEFLDAYIKPLFGDRFTEERVLIDICKGR